MSPSQRATLGAEESSPPLRSESYSALSARSMARSAPISEIPVPSASSLPRMSRQRRKRSSSNGSGVINEASTFLSTLEPEQLRHQRQHRLGSRHVEILYGTGMAR